MNYTGIVYRAHARKWDWAPTSGEGARLNGGRFNRKGRPALYLSFDRVTADLECNQGLDRIPPMTIVTYDVDVSPLADLTRADNYLGLSNWPVALDCAWLELHLSGNSVPTWDLADNLIERSYVGAIVPSFAKGAPQGARNLVMWKWGDDLPSKVIVYDPDGDLVPSVLTQPKA